MRKTILALFCLGGIQAAQAAIELNAKVTEITTPMGFKAQFLTFRDNARTISYEFPRGWTASGGGAALKLTPPEFQQAHAEITQAPLPAPQNLDEETRKALREKALASIPSDSQSVTVVSEEVNTVVFDNSQSYEAIISYQAFGQEFMTGLIYMNFPDTQVRCRTVARKADFEKVHTAFRRSLFTWQWK